MAGKCKSRKIALFQLKVEMDRKKQNSRETEFLRERSSSVEEMTLISSRIEIFEEINSERQKQDGQWGGADKDDNNSQTDWIRFIGKQLDRAEGDMNQFRNRMLKVSAVAIAAIESFDRKKIRETQEIPIEEHSRR